MPLMLGKRADVARGAAPPTVDRSGLTEDDWRVIAVDRAFRDAHFAGEDAAACRRKIAKLDRLLDDPDLARDYPPDHPDRLDAIARHTTLVFARKRHEREARAAAKEAATAWERIVSAPDRLGLCEGFARGWADSGVFPLVSTDPVLGRLPFWAAALRAWNGTPERAADDCPFWSTEEEATMAGPRGPPASPARDGAVKHGPADEGRPVSSTGEHNGMKTPKDSTPKKPEMIHALRMVTAPDPGPPPPLTPSAARLVRAFEAAEGEEAVERAVMDADPTWEDYNLADAFIRWLIARSNYGIACRERLTVAWKAVDPAHEATFGDVVPLAIERGLITAEEVAAALWNPLDLDILDAYAGAA